MRRASISLAALLGLAILTALACGPSIDLPKLSLPSGARETAASAAEQAGRAAQTVAAVATRQAGAAVSTLSAIQTPDLNALREKVTSAQIDPGGNFSVTVSDDELNQMLRVRQFLTGMSVPGNFQDISVVFEPGNVILNANVLQPLPTKLAVSFQPVLQDGQLTFQLVSASLSDQEAPPAMRTVAQSVLNRTLGEAVNNLPAGVSVRAISVGQGTVTFEGSRVAAPGGP
jgi:hypothetical protein